MLSHQIRVKALVSRYLTNKHDTTQAPPKPINLSRFRISGIRPPFEGLSLSLGQVPTRSSAVRRSPPEVLPLDLHVLGIPPALILSQDQTLMLNLIGISRINSRNISFEIDLFFIIFSDAKKGRRRRSLLFRKFQRSFSCSLFSRERQSIFSKTLNRVKRFLKKTFGNRKRRKFLTFLGQINFFQEKYYDITRPKKFFFCLRYPDLNSLHFPKKISKGAQGI